MAFVVIVFAVYIAWKGCTWLNKYLCGLSTQRLQREGVEQIEGLRQEDISRELQFQRPREYFENIRATFLNKVVSKDTSRFSVGPVIIALLMRLFDQESTYHNISSMLKRKLRMFGIPVLYDGVGSQSTSI